MVVPVFNESEVLAEFHRRLSDVLAALALPSEVVFVNDGSADQSLAIIRALRQQDPRITIVDLSRNFGKEVAMTAGLHHARGAAVVVIDADLQDPPELIPQFVRLWQERGYDVVYGQRTSRAGESVLKRTTAYLFYRLIQHTNRVRMPADVGDFRLMSRRAVDALNQLTETQRFMKGLFAWIGFPQIAFPYERDRRYAGNTKFNYWRLWTFALEGITSYTTFPLKAATYLGLLIAGVAFFHAGWIVLKTLLFGEPVPGYPSMMVVILMLGGVQLMGLGVLGEYVGRMFNETKGRPLYFLNEYTPAELPEASGEEVV